MLTQQQVAFLQAAEKAAQNAGHIFPTAAACEAALESAWGSSELFRSAYNVFGQKQSAEPIFETIHMPTQEWDRFLGRYHTVEADFVKFPSVEESFRARMALLTRLAPEYPHYQAALTSTSAPDYLNAVSQSWSTDPRRAAKCLQILSNHADVFSDLEKV